MKSNKEVNRIVKTMFENVMRSLINEGIINPEGKTGLQLLEEAQDYISGLRDEDLIFIIDHTGDLLKQARIYKKEESNELACLFYALYVEHQLNSFMATLAKKKNLSAKDIESLIRDSSYKAKCSWLLHIFDVKALNVVHMNRIVKLMELRNSFVHYKWKPENEQTSQEMESVLEQIEKTVKYLRNFEAKYLAVVPRRRVVRLLKKRA